MNEQNISTGDKTTTVNEKTVLRRHEIAGLNLFTPCSCDVDRITFLTMEGRPSGSVSTEGQ